MLILIFHLHSLDGLEASDFPVFLKEENNKEESLIYLFNLHIEVLSSNRSNSYVFSTVEISTLVTTHV